jgi:hypothetical protein
MLMKITGTAQELLAINAVDVDIAVFRLAYSTRGRVNLSLHNV